MATYTNRNGRWRVQLQVNGTRKSKTFPSKSHAQQWVKMMERDTADISVGVMPAKTFGELLERYDREVSVTKGGERWEHVRINKLLRDPIAKISNRQLSPQDVADWRDRSAKAGLSGSSIRREWGLLSAVCERAIREWGWLKENPFRKATKPKSNPDRTRRPTDEEIIELLKVMGFSQKKPVLVSQRLAYMMLFGIETAMRTSEMCSMRWGNVGAKLVHIPESKNGDARDVPLSRYARELLETLRGDEPDKLNADDSVFDMKPSQVDANFRKAKKKANIEDLHFHDFRREALTRLAKKVGVMELAKISGHRDVKILLNVYYRPKMDDIADMLD